MMRAPSFVIGLTLGILLGILAIEIPILGGLLLVGVIASTLAIGLLMRRPPIIAICSGLLLGSGGLFLFATINTYVACVGTSNFCGNTPILPTLGVAIVALVIGDVVGLYAARTDPSTT